ncbi:MAG: CBS domain-containing protein [Gammaproteobacteria bacterium]|nr:CBS domain-containing protein [Gammaproteobacteria bacterium]
MKVQEIMTSKVETISPTNTAKEAARKMHDLHIGSLPVLDGDQLVGILTDRDICVRVTATGRDAAMTLVKEVMGTGVETCFEDQDINDAAKLMIDRHIRRLVVLNRDNGISGFLSIDNMARKSHELASTVLEATIPIH